MRARRGPSAGCAAGAAGLIAAAAVVVVVGYPGTARAAVPCTPQTGFTACVRFSATGADQTFTVPADVTRLNVKLWGAGGGPGWGSGGGGGGFTTGTVAVTSGQVLTVTAGKTSAYGVRTPIYGGGGQGGGGDRAIGGNGGGMSALWSNGYGTGPLLIAGGGGGAPSTSDYLGGGGGGATGGDGGPGYGGAGAGGSQSAGGAAGVTDCSGSPGAGTRYVGGAGSGGAEVAGGGIPLVAGKASARALATEADGGGGGGGGYYGGGGGACQPDEGGANRDGSGGGGSGYVGGAGVSAATTTAASGGTSAGAGDALYVAGVGAATAAGDGEVVIQYAVLTSQTISFPRPSDIPLATGTRTVAATASSEMVVAFSSATLSVCTVSGTTVTLLSAGTCSIDADQAGNGSTAPAPTVRQSFTVIPAAPSAPARTSTGAGTTPQSVTLPVPAGGSVTLLNAASQPVTTVTVIGQGTYTLDTETGIVTFTAVSGYTGTATAVGYRLTDAYAQTGSGTYTATVTAPAAPTAAPRTSTGVGTAAQSVTLAVPSGGSVTLLNAASQPVATVTVIDQGTYTLDTETGVVTFTPVLGYAGTATLVGYRVTDAYAQSTNGTYTPSVTAPPGPVAAARTSTGVGTAAQSVTLAVPSGGSATLLNTAGQPATTVTVIGQGTYTLDTETGVVTFAAEFGYAGTVTAVGYRLTDSYAQSTESTYTPTVTAPSGPVAAAKVSTGAGTAVQSVTLSIPTGGSVTLLNAASQPATTVTVAEQGTYSLNAGTGVVTFTPVLGYTGTATEVTYRLTDAYEQSTSGTYTPTVTIPAAPTATARTSTGVGTAAQTVTLAIPAGGSVTLVDGLGEPATSVTVSGQGTYVLDAETGAVTFTPVLGYAGTTTGVTYRLIDAYGQPGDSTYTATVTAPAAPAVAVRTSTGIGIAPQSVTIGIPAGGSVRLVDGSSEPATTVTIEDQGTYTLDTETGVVTFVPVFGFSGAADPVTYRVTDAYQQGATSTYTPTVTPPAGPSATARTSAGTGTDPQSVTITIPAGGSVSLLGAGDAAVTTVTVAGEGTYTLDDESGIITFVPVFGFAGTTAVRYQVTDAYGQTGAGTYTATVTAPGASTAEPLTSTGAGTETQTVTADIPEGGSVALVDTDGDPVTSLLVDGQGGYLVDTDTGVITFTPELGYLGEADSVGYRLTTAYGQSEDSTYTPTVTLPPPPTAPDETSRGVGTTRQTVDLSFPAGGSITLLDDNGEPAPRVTFAGRGTYTLSVTGGAAGMLAAPARLFALAAAVAAPDGTAIVVFAPVLGYAGTAPPVSYQVADAYGQTAVALYTPTVLVPAAPAAIDRNTSGTGNDTQRVAIAVPAGGEITLVNAAGRSTNTVTFAGEGTYTLDPETGVITFVAVDGFTGDPSAVTYRLTDAYGQSREATYAAFVTGSSQASGDGTLPATGQAIASTFVAAALLVSFGALLLLVGRPWRRRRSSATG